VNRGQHRNAERRGEHLTAALCHFECRAHHRLGGGGAEKNYQPRADHFDLGFEPGAAGAHVHLARLAVEPALAPPLEAEMLDHVREVDLRARNACRLEGFVQDAAGRPDERPALDVLAVTGLLADQHQARALAALSKHGLSRILP
jgi:hypothetical protein